MKNARAGTRARQKLQRKPSERHSNAEQPRSDALLSLTTTTSYHHHLALIPSTKSASTAHRSQACISAQIARTTPPTLVQHTPPSSDPLATAFRPNSTTRTKPKQPWQLHAMAMLSENQISSSNYRRSSSAESSGRRSASNTTASAYVVNAATMDLTAYQYSTCGAGGMYTPCEQHYCRLKY